MIPGLVGRHAEMERLRRFVAELAAGPAAVTIEGDPEIGKTALLEATLADLPADLVVLRARCSATESALAYAGLGDLLGGYAGTAFALLPPPQRHALDVVLLRSAPGPDGVEPHCVGRAVLTLLRALAAAPVLIAIDDVHWLDPASARTLAFALRRLDDEPIGLLATRRRLDRSLPLGLPEAMPEDRRVVLPLGPLPDDDVVLLIQQRFGDRLSTAWRRWLVRTAAGNPLCALELAPAGRGPDGPPSDPGPLPGRLEALAADRLDRLPPAAATPLAAVACLAHPTVAQLAAVLGTDTAAGLDSAIDDGVVLAEEGRIRFSHPLFGMAALTRIPPSARRALHARLADAVTDVEARAHHLVRAAAGPDAAAAAVIEKGADRARARGAPEVAAELAEAAVRLTPLDSPEDIRRRRVAAGYHRVALAETDRGRRHLAAAVRDAPAGPVTAELRWRLAMVTLLDGDLDEAVALLETALAESAGHPALVAMVAAKLTGVHWWRGQIETSLRYGRMALAEADRAGDPRAQLDALILLGRSAAAATTGEFPQLAERIEALGPTVLPRAPHEDPQFALTWVDAVRGDYPAAAGRLETVYQRALDEGDEIGICWIGATLVEVELILGDWTRARRLADDLTSNARRLALPAVLMSALHAGALVDAHLGNVDTARATLAQTRASAERHGVVPIMLQAGALAGFVALSTGDSRAAHAELCAVLEQLDRLGIHADLGTTRVG
jgi:hypothetical protein